MSSTAICEAWERGLHERKFEQIIGSSSALEAVLDITKRVATTDSKVLILGETGTGKELIARAVHDLSSRSNHPFIKLNCAAIPLDLLESEMFGHEKGAFTGAIAQKLGRFEMADGGTLFLDEVGDIPLALQPKLLRALQEQEFERLGSTRTHHVNVRVVAATHRNLEQMVARNEFREDLYYRLNVFPIIVPPLRERREDIPELVTHFVSTFSRAMGKPVDQIPPETMAAFMAYTWPGNIRELQNLIERAVILANDHVLPNPLPVTAASTKATLLAESHIPHDIEAAMPRTLRDFEHTLILRTLEATGWVLGGNNGAAVQLGLKRTTLIDRMRRYGIKRPAQHIGSPEICDTFDRLGSLPAA